MKPGKYISPFFQGVKKIIAAAKWRDFDRFAQKMQDHVRERNQTSSFFLSTLLERLSSSDTSTHWFQWGSQHTVLTLEMNCQFIKRLSDWLGIIQEINKWINNLWHSINIFSSSIFRANTPVSHSPLLHQKPTKMKKGQRQTSGNRHLQGQGYLSMRKLLCMTYLHFTLHQSRTGHLHRPSQPASI